MEWAVEMQGVHKTYVYGFPRRKKKHALRGVDLSVPKGVFWGILGPNGAGKTTLISILSNLTTAEKGKVMVLGEDIRTRAGAILARINLSSGHANFPWSMTVQENLRYYGMLYGLVGKSLRQRIDELLAVLDLQEFARVPFDGLSTGTKQKLALAKALLNDPDLLFLDEPTVGLDPDVAIRVRECIRKIHQEKGTTILMTTHNMKEAESLCEKVAFIKEGTIKALGRPQDLKKELRLGDTITLFIDPADALPSMDSLPGVHGFHVTDGRCRVIVDDHRRRLPQILALFVGRGVLIRNLTIEEVDLEDVFLTLAK